jgi:hypothetical protein
MTRLNGHALLHAPPTPKTPAGWYLAVWLQAVVSLAMLATWSEWQFYVLPQMQAVASESHQRQERERLLDEANKTVEIRQAAILVQQERLRDATEENLRLAAELKRKIKGE